MKLINFLSALSVLTSSFAYSQTQNCPTSPFNPLSEQVVVSGKGNTKQIATKRAFIDLSQSLQGTSVYEQFQQSYAQGETKLQSNAQVLTKSKGNMFIEEKAELRCKQGYISYLLYDKRSLAKQIKDAFNGKAVYLQGEQYLIQSPLLKAHHDKKASNKITVQLLANNNGNYTLLLGQSAITVKANKLEQLINFSENTYLASQLISVPNLAVKAGEPVIISLAESKTLWLFLCTTEGRCQILQRKHIGQSELILVNSAAAKQMPTYQVNHIIALEENIPQIQKLVSNLSDKPHAVYLALLNTLTQYPNKSAAVLVSYEI